MTNEFSAYFDYRIVFSRQYCEPMLSICLCVCVVSIHLHINIVPTAIAIRSFVQAFSIEYNMQFYLQMNLNMFFFLKKKNDAVALNTNFEYLWVCVHGFECAWAFIMWMFVLAHTFAAILIRLQK